MSLKTRRSEPSNIRPAGDRLETAIGHEVRRFRNQLGLTIADVCELTGLSPGMMSKIENGNTSPSLSTLQTLAAALKVPVSSLFRGVEGRHNATYVPAGKGLKVDFQGLTALPQFELLGHSAHPEVFVEPYLMEFESVPDELPVWRDVGHDFVYVLEGSIVFNHGETQYTLRPGDSLSFNSDVTHGIDEFLELPFRCLMVYSRAL